MDLDAFRYYTDWHWHCNRNRYDAPAHPWDVIRVDPHDVEYYAIVPLTWGIGRVVAGEWDRTDDGDSHPSGCDDDPPKGCRPIAETQTYRGLIQRFEEGYDWEETVYYERARKQFENEGTVRGYDDLKQFRQVRCAQIDELFRRMRDDGYRPNAGTHYDTPDEIECVHQLEPLVLIGRSGELYWTEGFHRFVFASILDLDEIPVYVLCRHEQWQQVREQFYRISSSESELPPGFSRYAGHPDLERLD